MKALRTLYPYGLNEGTKEMGKDIPIGKLFPSLPRYGPRRAQTEQRRVNRFPEISDINSLLAYIKSFPASERGNKCRRFLEECKIKTVKALAKEASTLLASCNDKDKRWYDLIIDVLFTKTFKKEEKKSKKRPDSILPIFFDNKGLEYIQLGSILRTESVRNTLPRQLIEKDPPSIVYSLGKTIRNKIFNYKDTISSIDINDHATYGTGIRVCECQKHSEFIDKHHGHVITGNLKIIKNNKLRKLISKGPNFREPRSINWNRCKTEIFNGLDLCITSITVTNKNISVEDLQAWKDAVINKVDQKIQTIKHNVQPQGTNPILKQNEVIQHLNDLHSKYTIVPIDKAANNVALICKKYYVEVILREIGVLGEHSTTYSMSTESKEDIMEENLTYCKRLNLEVSERDHDLPCMYWLPKLHKNPSKARFIIASKHCSTKPLSKTVSSIFKLIYMQIENFHKKAKFMSHYNKFWVLQNVDPVLKNISLINRKKRAKSITTYDFSTLYTTLPHDKLISRLEGVIDVVYRGGDKTYLCVSKNGRAYWGKKFKGSVGFTKASLKMAVKHLIENCYFTVGNCVLRQDIGIPMGIDPAPFWANLFLYTYEEEYMSKLVTVDKEKARHFHSTNRFIDDLCTLNDGEVFGEVFQDIYPPELELKMEHSGKHGTFLNLDITVKDGVFVYKLFDKRDEFPFSIVRMPHMDSNIPQIIFYSALVGEFLRIARSTLLLDDFIPKAKDLLTRMRVQGSSEIRTRRSLTKLINKHTETFCSFNCTTEELLYHVI